MGVLSVHDQLENQAKGLPPEGNPAPEPIDPPQDDKGPIPYERFQSVDQRKNALEQELASANEKLGQMQGYYNNLTQYLDNLQQGHVQTDQNPQGDGGQPDEDFSIDMTDPESAAEHIGKLAKEVTNLRNQVKEQGDAQFGMQRQQFGDRVDSMIEENFSEKMPDSLKKIIRQSAVDSYIAGGTDPSQVIASFKSELDTYSVEKSNNVVEQKIEDSKTVLEAGHTPHLSPEAPKPFDFKSIGEDTKKAATKMMEQMGG